MNSLLIFMSVSMLATAAVIAYETKVQLAKIEGGERA